MSEEQVDNHESDDEWPDESEPNNRGKAAWQLARDLKPNVGDLIEFNRGIIYSHWGLYAGNGYIIHVNAEDKNKTKAMIVKELLEEVANRGGDNNTCRVNNLVPEAKKFMDDMCYHSIILPNTGGILQTIIQGVFNAYVSANSRKQVNPVWKPRNAESCMRVAEALVNEEVPYNFLGTNCEYYVTEWKYRHGFTEQVDAFDGKYARKSMGMPYKQDYK